MMLPYGESRDVSFECQPRKECRSQSHENIRAGPGIRSTNPIMERTIKSKSLNICNEHLEVIYEASLLM
jgi:hypothetical protein